MKTTTNQAHVAQCLLDIRAILSSNAPRKVTPVPAVQKQIEELYILGTPSAAKYADDLASLASSGVKRKLVYVTEYGRRYAQPAGSTEKYWRDGTRHMVQPEPLTRAELALSKTPDWDFLKTVPRLNFLFEPSLIFKRDA